MNRREISAFVLSVFAVLPQAVAQSPSPNASPRAPAVAPPQAEAKPPIRANRDAFVEADARHCLELPTNAEVIACAEKYRPHKRNS